MRAVAVLATIIFGLMASPTAALADDESAAAELFSEGRTLLKSGELDAACEKFAASMRTFATVSALANLALCHERQGRLATALEEYKRVLDLARSSGRDDQVQVARARAASLVPRVPTLRIELEENIEGLAVNLDGEPVSEAEIGRNRPLDPGAYVVEATAPMRRKFRQEVELREGDQTTIRIPKLVTRETPEEPNEMMSTAGWVVLAVGAATSLAGAVSGIMVLTQLPEQTEQCVDHACDPVVIDRIQEIGILADAATALLVIGPALMVSGGILAWLGAGDSSAGSDRAVSVTLNPLPGGFGATVLGRF